MPVRMLLHAFYFLFCLAMPGQGMAGDGHKVTFPRQADALQLSAHVWMPEGNAPYPAVVLLHGCNGIGIGGGIFATYSSWARHLTNRGYAVLLLDSASPRSIVTTCDGRSPERARLYAERPGDAYSALAYLQSRADILPGKIGLMGWSQGGGITLLTVSDKSIGRPRPAPQSDFAAAVALYPSACSETR